MAGQPQFLTMSQKGFDEGGFEDDEYAVAEEGRPECKICFATRDLVQFAVCECAGTMGNICINCLRQSIVTRPEGDHQNQYGWPVCPDCQVGYRHIDVRRGQSNVSFMQHMQLSSQELAVRLGSPIGFMGFISAIYWLALKDSNYDQDIINLWIGMLVFIAVFGYGFAGCFFLGKYGTYRNRPETIVDVIPAIEGRPEEQDQETSL